LGGQKKNVVVNRRRRRRRLGQSSNNFERYSKQIVLIGRNPVGKMRIGCVTCVPPFSRLTYPIIKTCHLIPPCWQQQGT